MPRLPVSPPGSRPIASTSEVTSIVTSKVTEAETDRTSSGTVARSQAEREPTDSLQAGPAISVEHVRRVFTDGPEPLEALADVSFEVAPEEIVAVVGPNGSGKSTLLRVLAGLLPATSGRVQIGGAEITEPDARIGFVFQEPRLLPWRRLRDNLGLPMELAGWPAEARRARTEELLELVGLEDVPDVRPSQLSGGLRQRLAIARALALGAGILLMDEPFSALDALTRERLNVEMLRLWERTRTTTVLVTHSIPEAVVLADRVLVLSPRPARVAAEVRVELPGPRTLATLGTAAFAALAAEVRLQLELGSGGEPATERVGDQAGGRNPLDEVDRLGRPAWFDPFGRERPS